MPVIPALRQTLAGLALVLAAAGAWAQARGGFEALVVHVTDGDTLWVRPVTGGPAQSIRIEGIDAPELCQAHGPLARQALADRVTRERVTVAPSGQDDFGRTVARIELADEDIGSWLVMNGHAWSYRFRRHPGPYAQEQAAARSARIGLWQMARPIEPRKFRRWHGPCTPNPVPPER